MSLNESFVGVNDVLHLVCKSLCCVCNYLGLLQGIACGACSIFSSLCCGFSKLL